MLTKPMATVTAIKHEAANSSTAAAPSPSQQSNGTASAPSQQDASLSATNPTGAQDQTSTDENKYPIKVLYCPNCTLPAEYHGYVESRNQFEKCKPWLGENFPELFPEMFPEQLAAKLERLKLQKENSTDPEKKDDKDGSAEVQGEKEKTQKVAKPIVIKNSSGKKKKIAAEVVIELGQRKGRKTVTIIRGLETYGIKLTAAAKVCKKKFATGSTVTKGADNREILEVQGSWQREFAEMCDKDYRIPKNTIFVIAPGKKKEKIKAFPNS